MERSILPRELKFLILLTLLFLPVIFVLPAILSFGLRFVPYSFQPPLLGSQKLSEDTVLVQEFTSPEDNLAAVGVSIRNFNLQSKADVFLEIVLDGKVVRKSEVLADRIKDGDIVVFEFDKIPDSLNKKLVFRLTAPNLERDKAYEVYTTDDQQDFAGNFSVNGVIFDKPLSFLLFFAPSSRLALIEYIYKNWFVRLSEDFPFFILYNSLILSLVFLILHFQIKRR